MLCPPGRNLPDNGIRCFRFFPLLFVPTVPGESSIVGYTFDGSFVGNYPAFQLQDQSNVDIQALCDSSVYMVTHQQLADFYETNNEHQKLGRRIAETLLWEVYDPDDFNV